MSSGIGMSPREREAYAAEQRAVESLAKIASEAGGIDGFLLLVIRGLDIASIPNEMDETKARVRHYLSLVRTAVKETKSGSDAGIVLVIK